MKISMAVLAFILSIVSTAMASEEVTQSFTLDGRLYSDAAATTPLLDTVAFKFQILNSAQTCILYEESQSVDTVASNGFYTVQVGQKRTGIKRTAGDSDSTLAAIFSNSTASLPGKLVSNGTACAYVPLAGDARYLKVTVTPSDLIPRSTITNLLMDSVPMAMVAERAETLQGFGPSSFLKTTDVGTGANQIVQLNGTAQLPAVDGALLTSLNPANLSGAVSIAKGGTGQATKAAGYNALSPNSTKGDIAVHDGTTNVRLAAGANNYVLTADSAAATGLKWAAVPAATVADASYLAKGIVQFDTNAATSGITIASGVANVNFGTGANQLVKLDGSSKLPAVDGSALTNLNAGNIATGTLPIARGGTAATSFPSNTMIVANGTGSALASFTCGVGEYLTFGAAGIAACGNGTSGTGFVNGGNSFGAAANLGTNDAQSLNFKTNNTTKMTILSGGNVGIGTTTPGAYVDINGPYEAMGSTQGMLAVSSNTAFGPDIGGSISFGGKVDGTATFKTFGMIAGFKENSTVTNEAGYLSFGTRVSGGLPAERMRITSTGSVGIGTTTPTGKFDVQTTEPGALVNRQVADFLHTFNGGSSGQVLQLIGMSSGGVHDGMNFVTRWGPRMSFGVTSGSGVSTTPSEQLTILSSGNVGIGTTAPLTKFEVVDGTIGARSATQMPKIAIWGQAADSFPASIEMIGSRTNGTTAAQSNDVLGQIVFKGLNGGGGAGIYAVSSENQLSTANGTFLAFQTTASGGNSNLERVRIDHNGRVGIGNAAPRAALDVTGSIIGTASVLNGTSTIDFSGGNIQHTTADCGGFALHNLKDGGTYMFVVKGTAVATCAFTAFSGAGTGALTVHMPPNHTATTTGKHTIYNLVVSGGDVYLAWTPGY